MRVVSAGQSLLSDGMDASNSQKLGQMGGVIHTFDKNQTHTDSPGLWDTI